MTPPGTITVSRALPRISKYSRVRPSTVTKPDESGRCCCPRAAVLAIAPAASVPSAAATRRTDTRIARSAWDDLDACMAGLPRKPGAAESAVGLQHVFEPHPLLVEEQIDVPTRAVAVLEDDQLRRAVHIRGVVVHLMTIEPEHDIRELFHRAEGSEIVELRPRVLSVALEPRQMTCRENAEAAAHREPFQCTGRDRHVLLQGTLATRERLHRVDDEQIGARVALWTLLDRRELIGLDRGQPGQSLLHVHARSDELGASLLVECPAAQVIEPNACFDRECALRDS